MIDWVKELILQIWNSLIPFKVIYLYERGVRLRLGKHALLLKPGFHLKIPFVDEINTCNVENETQTVKVVHITTTDGKTVTTSPVIKYKITDAIKWIMEANDAATNLHDVTRGVTADHLTDISWEDCKKKTASTMIKNKLNKKVEDLGVEVSDVMLTIVLMC